MNPYLAVAALVFMVSLMFMLPLVPALWNYAASRTHSRSM